MRNSSPALLGVSCALALASLAAPASAAPPGDWSIAVERLFGYTRLSVDDLPSSNSFSLLSKVTSPYGYSMPRLAFDLLSGAGFSFGGGGGVNFGDDGGADAWLVALRAGFFARPSRGFGIWPRAGLTLLLLDYGTYSDTASALTLEVPLEFLLSHGVALSLTPHADIGLGGSSDDRDRTITELGLQFGLGAFF
jgi:hypothetical protein